MLDYLYLHFGITIMLNCNNISFPVFRSQRIGHLVHVYEPQYQLILIIHINCTNNN